MTKPKRNPEAVLAALRDAVAAGRDLRVGQALAAALQWAGKDCDPFYVEDEDMARILREFTRTARGGR